MKNENKYAILCVVIKKGTISMGKNDKELEQISTTDKLKAFKALKDAGFRVELNGSGVPTVVCAAASDMDKELKGVRKVLKELRYGGSFGVRGPRKSDQMVSEDLPESAAEEAAAVETETTAEGVAIPA